MSRSMCRYAGAHGCMEDKREGHRVGRGGVRDEEDWAVWQVQRERERKV